jgi:predicted rRNA methylase YqxC with S4 and FtsJ domains
MPSTFRAGPHGRHRDGHRLLHRGLYRCAAEKRGACVRGGSGTNQLAWKLRQDPRVTVLEQTSARILTPEHITAPCGWVVCDASFIGLAKVLDAAALAAPDAAWWR